MTCPDILAANASIRIETAEPPACLADLNLDQLIEAITATRQPYNLTPFYYTPLRDVETIRYRQAIMRELEDPALLNAIKSFSEEMATVYRYLAMQDKLTFAYHQRGWFLEAALLYCHAVSELTTCLNGYDLQSQGLRSFRQYLTDYCHSPQFESLQKEAMAVQADLKQVRYSIVVQPGKFSVRRYEGESDYTTEIEQVFARFRQGKVKDFLVKMPQSSGMNHIEAQILTFVARLYPAPFAALDRFYES
ncbi:MAG: DNA mismatch repair protein MutS, partial [Chloroflexi bacterium]|nr:DNA mismatch repair protein MutS [Chloroflexota bacterium]